MPPAKKTPAKTPVTLPGGYKVGEKVFFTGTRDAFPTGNKFVHGQQGEVTGPALDENIKGKGVAVLFPGNKDWVDCYLYQLPHCPHPMRASAARFSLAASAATRRSSCTCTTRTRPTRSIRTSSRRTSATAAS